jgi:hypothetical protein
MRMIDYNINSYMRVKLTSKGREVLGAEYAGKEWAPKPDADGWYRLQGWEVMQLFGPHIQSWSTSPM